MRAAFLLVALAATAAVASARLGSGDPTPPTLPQRFKANCNQTVTMPMMGTVNLQGDCWYDFIDKKIRQDGEMSSPFGTMPVRDIKWYEQTLPECQALQGSGCSYFAAGHTHSVDYTIATQMGMSQCQFTFKESRDDPLAPLVIPPGSTYTSDTFDGTPSDMWQWTWSPPGAPSGFDIDLTVWVDHANPTVLQRLQVHIAQMGYDFQEAVEFRDVMPSSASFQSSVWSDGVSSQCKLQDNSHDDHF